MQNVSNSPIDMSRYVAVGDSITSGYSDGALYYEGQLHAFANIIAGQLKEAGRIDFKQPLLEPASPGVDMLGHARLVLECDTRKPEVLMLVHAAAHGDVDALSKNVYAAQGPFHNMGVPGAKAITIVAPGFGNPANGPGNYNPFFTRMASDPAAASVLSDAVKIDPTIFTLFIGNNDALAFALCGGTENAITDPEGPAGHGFEGSLAAIVDALTAKGARGVIASLPSIASIPYFTAIPYDGLVLSASEARELNQKYKDAQLQFHEGKNAFVIQDVSTRQGKIRQAEKGERMLLDLILDPNKNNYLLAKEPIPKKYTLSLAEINSIETAIDAYNRIIRSVAEQKGLGFADIHSLVKSAPADRHYNPHTLSIDYRKRGVFSLDGLHPNAFGQALLANEFIRVLNVTFHTSIPQVQSRRYKGISFP